MEYLTENDVIQYKRRRFYDLLYLKKAINTANRDLQNLQKALNNVRAVQYDKPHTASTATGSKPDAFYNLLQKKADLEARKEKLIQDYKKLAEPLNSISEEERELIEFYFSTGSYQKAARKYNYSEATIFRKINRILDKLY